MEIHLRSKDLTKEDLYTSVKTLVETEAKHIHLGQQKLFTLYSIAFQYFLFQSIKSPGAYLIRIEDSELAQKLSRRSKDSSTRRFMQSLLLPRKLKYQNSTFYLDFFHIGSWALTADIPREKIKGAVIVKNTSSQPMTELEEENGEADPTADLPPDYFLTSLTEFVPKTITVAYNWKNENNLPLEKINFPFIKQEREKVAGLTISKEIDLDDIK